MEFNSVMDSLKKGKEALHLDGWINLLTGRGNKQRDSTMSTVPIRPMILRENDLTNMYRGDGFARRIVDLPTNEMTRKGFHVKGDTDGAVLKYLETFNAERKVKEILRWARLHGGAVGVLNLEDRMDWQEPVNLPTLQGIKDIQVYSRWRIDGSSHRDTDILSPRFGLPILYIVTPLQGTQFKVHWTRVVRIDGAATELKTFQENSYWNDSELLAPYERIRAISSVHSDAEIILKDFVTSVLNIDGLADMMRAGQEGLVQKRLQLLDMSRHSLNTMLLDKEEKYSKETTSIAGMDKLLASFSTALSATTGIPVTVLMGTSPKGLNATGESDIRLWYDNMSSVQDEKLTPVWNRIIAYSFLSKGSGLKEIPNWEVVYNPLWQMSEVEESERRLNVAKQDEIYIVNSVVMPGEVAESRFGGDEYSSETKLEVGMRDRTIKVNQEEDEVNRNTSHNSAHREEDK